MTNQTKIQILVGLLLVWGGTVLFQYLDDTGSQSSQVVQGTSEHELSSTVSKTLILSKNFTNPRQSIALSTPRNIFRPFDLPVPPKRTNKTAKAVPRKPTLPVTVQPQVAIPPGPSPLELATQRAEQLLREFRFLGYLKKGGESQAFLTKGQSIYIVKQGATVEGRIIVQQIDPTLVVLSTKLVESGDLVKAEIPLTKDS